MPTVLITYGLNPVTGLKLMVQPDQEQPSSWSRLRRQWLPTLRQWIKHPPRMQISLGTLVPEDRERANGLERLTRFKFFIAVETEGTRTALPTPTTGRQTGIQVYRHSQGEENYRAQVVRFKVGSRRRARRNYTG